MLFRINQIPVHLTYKLKSLHFVEVEENLEVKI